MAQGQAPAMQYSYTRTCGVDGLGVFLMRYMKDLHTAYLEVKSLLHRMFAQNSDNTYLQLGSQTECEGKLRRRLAYITCPEFRVALQALLELTFPPLLVQEL